MEKHSGKGRWFGIPAGPPGPARPCLAIQSAGLGRSVLGGRARGDARPVVSALFCKEWEPPAACKRASDLVRLVCLTTASAQQGPREGHGAVSPRRLARSRAGGWDVAGGGACSARGGSCAGGDWARAGRAGPGAPAGLSAGPTFPVRWFGSVPLPTRPHARSAGRTPSTSTCQSRAARGRGRRPLCFPSPPGTRVLTEAADARWCHCPHSPPSDAQLLPRMKDLATKGGGEGERGRASATQPTLFS